MATLYGTAGNDRLSGAGENDILFGHGGGDTLFGAAGADALYGGTGNDTLYGEAGNDTYFSGEAGDRIFEAFGGGIDEVRAWTTHGLADHVENLTLFTPGTTGYGNALDNRLVAAEGDEVLFGHGGSDTLLGLGGNDALYGGSGTDELSGGAGNDTYFAGEADDRVFEEAGAGIDEVRAWTSRTLSDNVENLILYTAGTSGTGNALANRITGAGGSETLDGGAGDDTLEGGAGSDRLIGGDGADVAVFSGSRWDYDITGWADGSLTIRDLRPEVNGDEGTDRTIGVEYYAFSDMVFSTAQMSNRWPVAEDQSLTLNEDSPISGRVRADDPDGSEGLSYTLSADGAPRHGTLTLEEDGRFTYTPDKDYFGTDGFTFTATDPFGQTSNGRVDLTVDQVRDDPVLFINRHYFDVWDNTTSEFYRPPSTVDCLDLDDGGLTTVFRADSWLGSGTPMADGNKLLFIADGGLYRLDLGTWNPQPERIADGGFKIIPAGDDVVTLSNSAATGIQIHRLDPSAADPEPVHVSSLATLAPGQFSSATVLDDTLYFWYQPTGAYPQTELYRVALDQTGAAPELVTTQSHVDLFTIAALDSQLYFWMSSGGTGTELYRLDPSQPNPVPTLAADINPGPAGSVSNYISQRWIHSLTTHDGAVYFAADGDPATPGESIYRFAPGEGDSAPAVIATVPPINWAGPDYSVVSPRIGDDQIFVTVTTGPESAGLIARLDLRDPDPELTALLSGLRGDPTPLGYFLV